MASDGTTVTKKKNAYRSSSPDPTQKSTEWDYYVLKTACAWIDIPKKHGSDMTCWRRLKEKIIPIAKRAKAVELEPSLFRRDFCVSKTKRYENWKNKSREMIQTHDGGRTEWHSYRNLVIKCFAP